MVLNYLLVFFACHYLFYILLSTVSAASLYFANTAKYLVRTLPCVLFGSLMKLSFAAHYASLWYSTTSLCNVSPWRHICSSIHASGNQCKLCFQEVIILLLNHQFTNQCLLIVENLHRDRIHSVLMPCLLQTVLLRLRWVFPSYAFLCSFFLLLCLSFSSSVKGLSIYK